MPTNTITVVDFKVSNTLCTKGPVYGGILRFKLVSSLKKIFEKNKKIRKEN